ncbi:unnamed protein product [Phyllotreta striolata]|uniref:Chemosensory protein 1 n=1 Tax=Phyllotreta striolata TaxID=444603 RepID=A0A1B1FKF7_PHYSR|nr:chemosensory protein 1 [Phyllotreta striolata]CAG9860431.1 unnamed protein product [Phyllotreta striolata]
MNNLTTVFFVLAVFCGVNGQGGPRGALTGRNYMERQLLCALEKGPCDVLGNQIKGALPEIIGNNCRACDPKQRSNARKMANVIRERYPEVWNALVEKYSRA